MTKTRSNLWLKLPAAALLSAVLVSFSGCAASPQWQAAMAARDTAPGKYRDGACKEFAQYVVKKVPGSETITWQWSTKSNYGSLVTAAHQAVTWKKGNEVWMMDNFSQPVWVGYITTPRTERVKQFFAHSYRVPPLGRPLELPVTPAIDVTVARTAKD
jgi:hypothetical protein